MGKLFKYEFRKTWAMKLIILGLAAIAEIAFLAGVSLDFVQGYMMPWDGILLPILTVPALFLHGKRPASDILEFMAGAMIPPVMAFPHFWSVLTTPDAFASLMMSSLFGAFLFPLAIALVARSAARLKIGIEGERTGGA